MTRHDNDHREAAVQIVRVLSDGGHTAYLAGGCVRDRLLGRVPKDYDIATDAPPDVVRRLFRGSRHVGEAFGVVLVPIRSGSAGQAGRVHHQIEVATFRTEWGYEDGRRPSHIEFTDAQHDAARRDFTINGLFENPLADNEEQRVIDFVQGRADLQRGMVRAIGDPDQRFAEDFLRMLRAVRFAARFDFQIEARTAAAIRRHADRLGRISRERIGQEVQSMLTPGPDARPPVAAALVQSMDLDAVALKEPHNGCPVPTLEALPDVADYPTALAAWVLDRHWPAPPPDSPPDSPPADSTPSQVRTVPKRLRAALCLSNEHQEHLKQVLLLMVRALGWEKMPTAARKRMLAEADWPAALVLLRAASPSRNLVRLLERVVEESHPLIGEGVAPAPFVNGDDLIAMGKKPGPKFTRMLGAVYDEQLEGRVSSRQDALDWLERNG